MAKAFEEPAPPTLDEGWRKLHEGHWEAARVAFERAVDAAEMPEAFEGLSWAAWWLDDGEAVFDARERAYRLYRDAGDVASAARMATWLASDQLDFHGAFAVGARRRAQGHRREQGGAARRALPRGSADRGDRGLSAASEAAIDLS